MKPALVCAMAFKVASTAKGISLSMYAIYIVRATVFSILTVRNLRVITRAVTVSRRVTSDNLPGAIVN